MSVATPVQSKNVDFMYSTSDDYSAARLPADVAPAIRPPNPSCITNSCAHHICAADLSKKLLKELAEGCKHTQFVLQLELLLDLAFGFSFWI